MAKDFYDTLWISKWSTSEDIKKAYRKKAMEFHPDRNKWDSEAEKKFKEVNEAYSTLSDSTKKKQYDTFGSTWWNPFWGGGSYSSWNSYSWWWNSGFSWFEDLFWKGSGSSWSGGFNMEDLFWNSWWYSSTSDPFSSYWQQQSSQKKAPEPEPVSLDFEKTYEVPIFDLILGCKIEVKWVYWQNAKLTIPAWTKPWIKFRVKYFWKSEWIEKWNLIVKIEAKMPKHISDVDKWLLERIREWVGY